MKKKKKNLQSTGRDSGRRRGMGEGGREGGRGRERERERERKRKRERERERERDTMSFSYVLWIYVMYSLMQVFRGFPTRVVYISRLYIIVLLEIYHYGQAPSIFYNDPNAWNDGNMHMYACLSDNFSYSTYCLSIGLCSFTMHSLLMHHWVSTNTERTKRKVE